MNEQNEQVDPGGQTSAGGPEAAAEIDSGTGSGEEGIATAEFAIVALATVMRKKHTYIALRSAEKHGLC